MKKILILLFICPTIFANDRENIFTHIYNTHEWHGGKETISGSGSTLKATVRIRKEIPQLLKELDIQMLLDAPCGDFNWMRHVDLSSIKYYVGMDIVHKLIAQNNKKYSSEKIQFLYGDITSDTLPQADLVLCRDCFLHLTFEEIRAAIANFKNNNIKYLLASTYPYQKENKEIKKTGAIRYLNLEKTPFNFPKPLKIIPETHDPKKVLGLWKLDELSAIVLK